MSRNKGVYPTSLLPHMKRKEGMIENFLEEIRGQARINLVGKLMKEHDISMDKAFQLLEEPEYESLLEQEMLKLKRGHG